MYCKECGKQLPDDSRFCDGCGTQVSGIIVSAQSDKFPELAKQKDQEGTSKAHVEKSPAQFKAPISQPTSPGMPNTPYSTRHRVKTEKTGSTSTVRVLIIFCACLAASGLLSFFIPFFTIAPILVFVIGAGCYGFYRFRWYSVSKLYSKRTAFTLPTAMTEEALYAALNHGHFTVDGMTGMELSQDGKQEIMFTFGQDTYTVSLKGTAGKVYIPLSILDRTYFTRMGTAALLGQELNHFFDSSARVVPNYEHEQLIAVRTLARWASLLGFVGIVLAMLLSSLGDTLPAAVDSSTTDSSHSYAGNGLAGQGETEAPAAQDEGGDSADRYASAHYTETIGSIISSGTVAGGVDKYLSGIANPYADQETLTYGNSATDGLAEGYLVATSSTTLGEAMDAFFEDVEWLRDEDVRAQFIFFGHLDGTVVEMVFQINAPWNAFEISEVLCYLESDPDMSSYYTLMDSEAAKLLNAILEASPSYDASAPEAIVPTEAIVGTWRRPDGTDLKITTSRLGDSTCELWSETLTTIDIYEMDENYEIKNFFRVYFQDRDNITMYYSEDGENFEYLRDYTRVR